MKHNREFEIAFVGLKPGEHNYQYTITDSFFEKFEKPEFWNAFVDIKLSLDKKSGAMFLKFCINGKVTIPCDRCADEMDITLWDEFELLVKIVEDEIVEKMNEEDSEVAYIGRSESILDLSPWIYEFIILSIPMQRIHGNDENEKSLCNPQVLDLLNNQTETNNNPIWEKLKNKF